MHGRRLHSVCCVDSCTMACRYLHVVDRRIRQLYDPSFTAGSLLVATWDAVGYYRLSSDLLNSFQAVVATASDGSTDTYACFFYKDIEWTVGMASSGTCVAFAWSGREDFAVFRSTVWWFG